VNRAALATSILALSLIFGLLGGMAWLLGTSDGARFLLTRAASQAKVQLSIGHLEGQFVDELRLHKVTLQAGALHINITSLRLHWQPGMLLAGALAIKELHLQGVTIQDNRPPTQPTRISWPTISGPAARISGWVSSLTISDLSYRRQTGTPLKVTRLGGRLDLRHGRIALTGLTINAPIGTASGAAGISFRQPEATLFVDARPAQTTNGLSRLLLHGTLKPGSGSALAGGTLRAVIALDKRRINLATTVGITATALTFPEISLNETQRSGGISGKARIAFEQQHPHLSLSLRAEKLDLAPDIPFLAPLSGSLSLDGSPTTFQGSYQVHFAGTAANSAALQGTISGNGQRAELTVDRGDWLGGALSGTLTAAWQDGLHLTTSLRGRNLDPARLSPEWDGVINLDANGELDKTGAAPLRARITGQLHASRLRGRPLTGTLAARIHNNDLLIERLLLAGKGFNLSAGGAMADRINLALRASDLGGLIPGSRGTLDLTGTLQRRGGRFGGTLSGTAADLVLADLRLGSATLDGALTADSNQTVRLAVTARNLARGKLQADTVRLDATGTMAAHLLNLRLTAPGSLLQTRVTGRYNANRWQGTIDTLTGQDRSGPWRMEQPATLTIGPSGLALSPVVISGTPGERLRLSGIWYRTSGGITLDAAWQQLNLARIGQWLPELRLEGTATGSLALAAGSNTLPRLTGAMEAAGSLTTAGRRYRIRAATLRLKTSGAALQADTTVDLAEQGLVSATLTATLAKGLTLPDRATFSGHLTGVDLKQLHGPLPEGLTVSGILSAQTKGELLPGGNLRLTAQAEISKGVLISKQHNGELRADLRSATLNADWRNERLNGTLALELAERGRLTGSFSLPLPARLPTALALNGPLTATLEGNLREQGLITALLPGLVQESRGEVQINAQAGGTWQTPSLTGTVKLGQAGFNLPRAGIRISDLQLTARLVGDQVIVDSFSARSGPGTLTGSATVRLQNWRPVSYQGTIHGDQFQFVYLPELQVTGSPRLDLSGTREKMTVRGTFTIPDLLITDSRTPAPVRPSADVIIVDAPPKKSATLPFALDMQIRALFGERVLVRAAGIDARLGGAVDLTARNLNDITGRGEIKVVKGSYKAYGVNLDITRGRLTFSGGPVNRPKLDILASRKVGDILAGVMIVGSLPRPTIRLYSEPALSDSDIMGYIVLGQPLSGDQNSVNAVMQAAGLLLTASQSAVLNEQIISKFGIDAIGVETDKTDVSQSIVTIGKYLTPKLFISYGRSLFSPASYLKARYTFSERWELETMTGTESSIDLYYKINFN
jgi:translocation and assembly module TamB